MHAHRTGTKLALGAAVLGVAAIVLPLLVARLGSGEGACAGCNVLLVSVDTLRADRVGLYRAGSNLTPRIDAFFGRGTVFEQAVSPSPCTLPAVAQVLTGSFDRAERRPRLAEWLAPAGYRTAAVVSQHWFGSADEPNPVFRRGFAHFDVQSRTRADTHGQSARTAREVADAAIEWLEAQADQGPFLLWLHFFDPHDPYAAPGSGAGGYAPGTWEARGDRRALLMAAARTRPDDPAARQVASRFGDTRHQRWRFHGAALHPDTAAHFVRRYDAEVAYTDRELGRVLDWLGEEGLLARTVVALIADHGEQLGEEGAWDHCLSLHEREIQVPFLLRVAGGPWSGGARMAERVSTLDLVPTLLGLLGIDAGAADFDGADLARVRPPRRFALWYGAAAAYEGPWKLHRRGGDAFLRRVTGPAGEADVAKQPAARQRLAEALDAFLAAQGAAVAEYEPLVERLEALGYID